MYLIRNKTQATVSTAGRKAYNLFLLKEYFNVPEFCVVSTAGFVDYQKTGYIGNDLLREISACLEQFFSGGKIAVRSSATSEDLPGLSFAGLYTTVLDVSNAAAGLAAIKKVFDSINNERAKVYCQKMHVPAGTMAVIIQHQLQPEVSGIMVTHSPFNVDEVLIECCPGLGEKLVAGEIVPTRYRFKDGKTIEHKGEDLLSQTQIYELVQVGKKIECIFSSPQDIEWAIEHGKLWVLQSRPVFVHDSVPRRRCTVWCNVNVRETIPDPVSPMMWSLFEKFLLPMIMIDVFGLPLTREKYRQYPGVENLSGRLYWNVNNTLAYGKTIGPFLDLMEADRNLDPQMATAMRAVDFESLPNLMPATKTLVFSVSAMIRLIHFVVKSFFFPKVFLRKLTQVNKEFEEQVKTIELTEDILTALHRIEKNIAMETFARRYFGGIFLSIFYFILLQKFLGLRMGKTGEAIARKSIIGLIDKTGQMAIALDQLSILAGKKQSRAAVESLRELYATDVEFQQAYDEFISEYGHRGPAEFDIASKTYCEDPAIVFRMIAIPRDARSYVSKRSEIINEILNSLKPMERTIFKLFLPRLEIFVPMRENGKHYYFKQMAKIRDQFLVIDRNLKEKGYLKKERDIFFMSWDDLKAVGEQNLKPSQTLQLVADKKKEWELFKQAPVPDIIYESGERVTAAIAGGKILMGEPLSYGIVRAKVRVIHDLEESDKLKKGEILVTHHSDPGWTPLFMVASGVIVEVGGLICHAAMVARELGIPAVVLKGATSLIADGMLIELDADTGRVTILNKSQIPSTKSFTPLDSKHLTGQANHKS